MLAEGLLGLQACAGVTSLTRPRHDSDGQSPASHRADRGWIPGHVRFVVGKVVLGQISLINPFKANGRPLYLKTQSYRAVNTFHLGYKKKKQVQSTTVLLKM